jgi:hypothetical protein
MASHHTKTTFINDLKCMSNCQQFSREEMLEHFDMSKGYFDRLFTCHVTKSFHYFFFFFAFPFSPNRPIRYLLRSAWFSFFLCGAAGLRGTFPGYLRPPSLQSPIKMHDFSFLVQSEQNLPIIIHR